MYTVQYYRFPDPEGIEQDHSAEMRELPASVDVSALGRWVRTHQEMTDPNDIRETLEGCEVNTKSDWESGGNPTYVVVSFSGTQDYQVEWSAFYRLFKDRDDGILAWMGGWTMDVQAPLKSERALIGGQRAAFAIQAHENREKGKSGKEKGGKSKAGKGDKGKGRGYGSGKAGAAPGGYGKGGSSSSWEAPGYGKGYGSGKSASSWDHSYHGKW
jgi:hypothetical protein